MSGRRARAALVLLVALVLAGCGGLSHGGPVEPGLDVASGNPQGLRVLFPGPAAGVDQVSIVRGFVRAGSASDGAYDNARAFLTGQTSEKWNPDRTLVLLADDGAPKVTPARPRDGAHHRSRGRHRRPRRSLHRGPRGQHGHRRLRPVDGGR